MIIFKLAACHFQGQVAFEYTVESCHPTTSAISQALHSQARTTHLIWDEIRHSMLSQRELAEHYNVSRLTIRKWQNRDSAEDFSHRPRTMHTTLTPAQELIVLELRTTLLLPTDDLLAVAREFVSPALSRAALGRCPPNSTSPADPDAVRRASQLM